MKMQGILRLCLALPLVNVTYGQRVYEQVDDVLKTQIPPILDALRQGFYGPATPEQIAEAKNGQLVSVLEQRFVRSQDANIKARTAKALIQLGDKNEAYWDVIAQQARLAIESDVPSSWCTSPKDCKEHAAYVSWARVHNAPEDSDEEMKLNWLLEERVQRLFGDPRGISLLREALTSRNNNVVWAAADELARAHDKDSISLIVEACKRFQDSDEVRQIGHTLRHFRGVPEAQAAAQAGEEQCLPPPDPLEALKRNNEDSLFYVGRAAATHPAETVATLKENFGNTQEERRKAEIASALIGLGDKEDTYWDFLLRMATSLLDENASSAMKNDAQGKPIEGPSPEDAWAKEDARFNKMVLFVETVAKTPDPRGLALLRRAVSSSNSDVQQIAAAGLARARDKDSIPLIIDACKNASPEAASAFASNALVYFDDARAQSAVDQYLSKEAAKFARDEKANGVGPLGPWPPK